MRIRLTFNPTKWLVGLSWTYFRGFDLDDLIAESKTGERAKLKRELYLQIHFLPTVCLNIRWTLTAEIFSKESRL